jgi:hypothetical protein
MLLYVIGPKTGKAFAIGLAATTDEAMDKLAGSEPLVVQAVHDLKPGWDQLALRIVTNELRAYDRGGWYRGCQRQQVVSAAARAAQRASGAPPKPKKPDYGSLMRYLRKVVFGVNQTIFGQRAGGATPPALTRWEAGEADPAAYDIYRLRHYAASAGLPWDDSWFFQPPEA